MTGIVDRIENEIVVVEFQEKMYDVAKDKCIGEINEGDVVDVEIEEETIITIKKNDDETTNREKYIADLIKNMWEN